MTPPADAAPHKSESPVSAAQNSNWQPAKSDRSFYWGLGILSSFYVLLIAAMIGADIYYAAIKGHLAFDVLLTPEVRYATWLSLISCSLTALLSLWVAVPIGYLLSRVQFRGKVVVDAILDIPIFLPPLVVGLSLLILFRQTPLRYLDDALGIALSIPAVIIAQFAVASAFAVRTMRATFDEISPRTEQVAMTLGCSRNQAFWSVVLPQARHGMVTAGTIAWARALGEFGPVMVFAGTTAHRTEVLPVSVHMEIASGNLAGAVGISLLMIVVAIVVLVLARTFGDSRSSLRGIGGRGTHS